MIVAKYEVSCYKQLHVTCSQLTPLLLHVMSWRSPVVIFSKVCPGAHIIGINILWTRQQPQEEGRSQTGLFVPHHDNIILLLAWPMEEVSHEIALIVDLFQLVNAKCSLDDDKTNIIACNWNLRRSNIPVQNSYVSIFNLVQQYMYEYICISTSTTFVDVRSKGPAISNCFEPIYSNIVWEFKCKVY